RLCDAAGAAGALEAAHEIEILHERDRPHAADRLVDRAAHEDARIAVVEAEPARLRIDPGEPAAEAAFAVKDDAKIAAAKAGIGRERRRDARQAAGRQNAIGVKEEEDLAAALRHAMAELRAAAGWARQRLDAMSPGDLARTVAAATTMTSFSAASAVSAW